MYPLVSKKFTKDEIKAVEETMARDQWTMGSSVKTFEAEFAKTVGSKYAVMVNSGSSANLVAITAYFFKKDNPLKRGDEVLVPAIAWATTWAPLWQLGLKARVVDVDLETLNVTSEAFRKAITPKTKMIIAVSILGNPTDLDAIQALCKEKNLHFMEDNCESLGATVRGRQAGTFGELNTASLYYSHHISTAEGGMITMDTEDMRDLCICLRAHGWSRDIPADSYLQPSKATPFKDAYRFLIPGYNVRPIELTGAMGLVQLKKLKGYLDGRRKNARTFNQMMQSHKKFTIQKERFGESSWFAFTMILPEDMADKREQLYQTLSKAGIESRMITGGNFLRHEMAKYFDLSVAGGAPNSDRAHDCGLFVANHDIPLETHIGKLDQTLKEFEKAAGL